MRAAAMLALCASAGATVHFKEQFGEGWEGRWAKSTFKVEEGSAGEFTPTAGKWHADPADLGIQTGPDARFFALSADMGTPFSTEGKDLVLQFSVKHEQKLDCGGGYIKLLPASSDMAGFGGDTPYAIMFGPDICGYSTKRVHVIFTYKGENLLTKQTIPCETDELSHVYTLVVKPDNTYQVLIDNVEKAAGSLYDDWDFLAPKTIKDPEASKPEEWDERPLVPDESDVKPEGHDDLPEKIPDPEATKPEDWDDEDDGEWEPPMMPNPAYTGPWVQKQVDNPAYQGIWEAPDIPNPAFVDDPSIYKHDELKYVGFELWQVKAGSIFDNIFVGDSAEEAAAFAQETTLAAQAAEKAMFEEVSAAEEAELAAQREAMEAEMAEDDDDADEDDDDYEDPEDEDDDEEQQPEKAHDEL